jgi:hypothetical protein
MPMNAEQLKKILREYPPNRKLRIIVDGATMQETTVLETLVTLIRETEGEGVFTPVSMSIFGRDSCIIRERIEDLDAPPGAAPTKTWLEMDLR